MEIYEPHLVELEQPESLPVVSDGSGLEPGLTVSDAEHVVLPPGGDGIGAKLLQQIFGAENSAVVQTWLRYYGMPTYKRMEEGSEEKRQAEYELAQPISSFRYRLSRVAQLDWLKSHRS